MDVYDIILSADSYEVEGDAISFDRRHLFVRAGSKLRGIEEEKWTVEVDDPALEESRGSGTDANQDLLVVVGHPFDQWVPKISVQWFAFTRVPSQV